MHSVRADQYIQDMPDSTADLLEFRRMQGSPVDCVVQTGYGGYRGLMGTFAFRAGP
jgi:hypothetical protein